MEILNVSYVLRVSTRLKNASDELIKIYERYGNHDFPFLGSITNRKKFLRARIERCSNILNYCDHQEKNTGKWNI